jgi:gliding motility-associated-like protein
MRSSMPAKTSKLQPPLSYIRSIIALFILNCFYPTILNAQCISNNKIDLQAICTGTGLALLKGSSPKGGNGNFTYKWERNTHGDCKKDKFVTIAGATTADYIIPKNSEGEVCYRRIVSSGNCKDESNTIKVKAKDVPAPLEVPKVSVQNPQNCSQPTGSITVTPVRDMEYSINGTEYQKSNVFNAVAPGTYKVTVKNSAGCLSAVTVAVVLPAAAAPTAPKASAQNPQSCSQATGSITVTPVQGMQYSINGTQYQQSNVFNNVAPGTYNVTVKNAAGCVSAATSVTVNKAAAAPTGAINPANASICEGKSQLLKVTGGTSYQWKRNGADIPGATSANYVATLDGTYSATIINGDCIGKASNTALIKVQACVPVSQTRVFVPEAFTPDRNNRNDHLQPYFRNVNELKYFKVFNRWGQMVFQTSVIGEGWDGTIKGIPQATETYSWMLECVNNNGKLIKQSGTTILVR